MLVDDSEMDNYYHSEIIRRTGITEEIRIAENGSEALDMLESKSPPELIFLDINMPGMNGWEFLEEYRKLDDVQKAKIVVIMLSTSLNPADRKHAEQIPEITEYRTKPLTKEGLLEIYDKYFA
jgi:CheY-like chemotaxis protein